MFHRVIVFLLLAGLLNARPSKEVDAFEAGSKAWQDWIGAGFTKEAFVKLLEKNADKGNFKALVGFHVPLVLWMAGTRIDKFNEILNKIGIEMTAAVGSDFSAKSMAKAFAQIIRRDTIQDLYDNVKDLWAPFNDLPRVRIISRLSLYQ